MEFPLVSNGGGERRSPPQEAIKHRKTYLYQETSNRFRCLDASVTIVLCSTRSYQRKKRIARKKGHGEDREKKKMCSFHVFHVRKRVTPFFDGKNQKMSQRKQKNA